MCRSWPSARRRSTGCYGHCVWARPRKASATPGLERPCQWLLQPLTAHHLFQHCHHRELRGSRSPAFAAEALSKRQVLYQRGRTARRCLQRSAHDQALELGIQRGGLDSGRGESERTGWQHATTRPFPPHGRGCKSANITSAFGGADSYKPAPFSVFARFMRVMRRALAGVNTVRPRAALAGLRLILLPQRASLPQITVLT